MKGSLVIVLMTACAGAQMSIPRVVPAQADKGGTTGTGARKQPAGRGAVATPAAGRGGTAAPAATAPAASAKPATASAGSGGGSPKDLKYPALRLIREPAPATFTLANGMKLSLLEDHDLPTVNGIAMVRTGGVLDPPDRIGLAQLTGITLRTGGTNVKTGEQIDALLDDIAGSVDGLINDSVGSISFTGLKEHIPTTLQLFKEILVQPGFRAERFEVAKSQLRAAVSRRNDSPKAVARREFASLIYGRDTPYGWQQEYATIDHITRAQARSFHQRYFFPSNVTLAVWGDFDTAEMRASIEKVFADWTVQQAAVPEFPVVKNAPSPGIFLAERKDATQTFFTIGHLGGRRDDKDFAPLVILVNILGGGPQSRIGERLRTKLGVFNDISAGWTAGYGQPGLFEISGSTKSVATNAAIKAVLEEIDRIRTAEVSEEEWRLARDSAVNSLVFSHDSRLRLMASRMLLDYHGYPKDYLPKHQQALQSVTRADLLRVAKQYLNPANLTIVVAANPAQFGEPLEKLGPVNKLDLSIPEAKPEASETTDASLAQGKQILMKAQAAAGGSDKLASVKDYTMLAEYAIDPAVANVGGSKIVQTDRWAAPTVFRQDSVLPAGRVTAFTDGKVGWISTPQGWGALGGVQRSQVLGDLFRVYYRLLLSDRLEGRTVNAIEESTVQITDTTGQVSTLEFDPQTFLAKRVAYDTQQAGGAPIYSEDVYEDYREVGGIKVPFKITINQGGRRFADTVVKDYKINTGLNAQELARRPQ